jgi:hypothetical protein
MTRRTPMRCLLSHAPDFLLSLEFIKRRSAEVAPPLKKHRIADEFEPGCEFEIGLREHLLESLGGDIFGITDLVRVDVEIDLRLDEEDVVN